MDRCVAAAAVLLAIIGASCRAQPSSQNSTTRSAVATTSSSTGSGVLAEPRQTADQSNEITDREIAELHRVATGGQVTSSADANGVYRVGGAVHAPRPILRVEPDFSKCKGTYSGAPVAEGIVHVDGSIQKLRLLRSVDRCIDMAFLSALQQWKFEPATLKGKPVDVVYTISAHIHYR